MKMRLTYAEVVQKTKELKAFVNNCESAINNTQASYNKEKEELENSWNKALRQLKNQTESNKKAIERKSESMLEDALQISGEISQIENILLIKDKYYKRTKIKKESELADVCTSDYNANNDYFQILDSIRLNFENISKKYREKILPGIINGIHYLFSKKRKEDYEELLVLQNTVKRFIKEIRGNINEIREDALRQIDQEYRDTYHKLSVKHQNDLKLLDSNYINNINDLTEAIGVSLDTVFPDHLIEQMNAFVEEYQYSLNKVFEKKVGTESYFSLFCLYLSMNDLNASGPIYEFISGKFEKLIIKTQQGDFLVMPVLGYADENSNWYFEWDKNNREFVQLIVCDLMYSILTRVPVGHLCFDIIDPISRGVSIRSYYDTRAKIPELFSERIYINSLDIDNHLNNISNYIDYISQRILGTRYNSVFEYSDEKDDYIPDIKYLVFFDFPKGVSDATLEMINNIVTEGPKCGVFTIIAHSYDELDVRKSSIFKKNLNEVKTKCTYVNIVGQTTIIDSFKIAFLAQLPERQSFNNYTDRYLLIRESIRNKGIVFPNMIKPLLLSNDLEEVSSQINTIVSFGNTMEDCKCFNVEDDIVMPREIGLGMVQYPVNLFEDSCAYDTIVEKFAKFSNFASMPFSVDLDDDLNILLLSGKKDSRLINDFSHNIIWSFFSTIPASMFKTCIIDLDGHGKSAIPFIDFCKRRPEIFYNGIVSTHDQARELLKYMVKRIDDVSLKRLGSKYKNIHEYNEDSPYGNEPITLLVIYDYSKVLELFELNEVLKIVENGNRCGIYTLLCGIELQDNEKRDATKMGVLDSIKKACTILEPVGDCFRLTPFNVMLQPRKQLALYQNGTFVERYIQALEIVDEREKNKAPENDFTVLFDIKHPPVYRRGNKLLHLPYGISAEGVLYYCDFEKENFAAFLCGSSGSGKSTLIHTLITGILMNNHPDDVELWLADFKMKEFRRYVTNKPPHIKYILLEESQDAVYDFLDRMYEKLNERERMDSSYSDLSKTPVSQYMPLIFVIIDEFSIMSQIIDKNEDYKLILQNLLAKGRGLGFRFLFSSQTFTTGVTGLSPTAKKQIQMRLAMKSPQEEISETIDMSKSLMSEEQKRWLLTLPKYYILLKKYVGEGDTKKDGKVQDEVLLTRAKGLYFPDDEYTSQNEFIRMISETYTPDDQYHPSNPYSYKDKKPVVVDGSIYYSFLDAEPYIDERLNYIKNNGNYADDAIPMFLGSPRSMRRVSEIIVENEFEENLILFGTDTEQCTSVLLSGMASLLNVGATISVIGYAKNRVYKRINETGQRYIDEDYSKEDEICNLIRDVKTAIDNGKADNLFLFVFGLDSILKNISFLSKSSQRNKKGNSSLSNYFDNPLVFGNDDENLSFEEKLIAEEAKYGIHKSDLNNSYSEFNSSESNILGTNSSNNKEPGIYDIKEDLEVIINEGPRLGYHVFCFFRTYDEFKQTKFKLELFKHRITFHCSQDDSMNMISKSTAFGLSNNAFLYTDMRQTFTMRPYLHDGLQWDGWKTDSFGHAIRAHVIGGD